MRKIIIVALMILWVSTQCFADVVEPERIFSIEGTQWQAIFVLMILPFPHILPGWERVGFSGGVIYPESAENEQLNVTHSFYCDMMVISFF